MQLMKRDKKTTLKKFMLLPLFVLTLCIFAFGRTEVKAEGYSGLAENGGAWYLYQDGEINYNYTGLYCDANYGWWLVQEGRVAFEYNDLYGDPNYGWWKVNGGAVDFGYTDLYCSPTCGWWKVNGGAVDFGYTDLYASPTCGWWKINGGAVDFGYTDLYGSPTCGWWKINGGAVDFDYTGLYNSPSCGWWLIGGGNVCFDYNDLWNDPVYGWWKVNCGTVDFGYTDLYGSPTCGWWKINGGTVDFGYTDLYNSPTCGWWLTNGGSVAFDYNDVWESPQYGAWKVNGGAVDFDYTGWFDSTQYGKCYVNGGAVDFDAKDEKPSEDNSASENTPEAIAKAFPYTTLAEQKEYHLKADNRGLYYLCDKNDQQVKDYAGLYVDEKGNYWLIYNGWVNVDYTGVYNTADSESTNRGKWYVKEGKVDKSYTAMVKDSYGTWYCEKGQFISTDYVGPYNTVTDDWCYFQQGAVNTQFSGLAKCNDGTYRYFKKGVFDKTFTGVFYDKLFAVNGTYYAKYVSKGIMSTTVTGIVKNSEGKWVYFENGCDTEKTRGYTGMVLDIEANVWRYFTYGKLNTQFTGMASNNGTWYYYIDGVWAKNYKGIGRCTENGEYYTWYIENGTVNKNFSGTFKDGIVTYQVTNGKAKAVDSETPLLGVFFNSRKDVTDTLYISFDGYEFLKISEAYTDAYPNDENNDLATSSPYYLEGDADWKINTIHDPNIRYFNGAFWVVGGYVKDDKYIPLIGYSTDLVNWSYPSVGTASNGTKNTGLVPTTIPMAQDGSRTNATNYHAVAQELFMDDNGDVYLTVSLGYYADNNSNKLTTYITKLSNLNYPAKSDALTNVSGKKKYSDKITVDFGPLVEINVPGYTSFNYDCSLYKENGKYYYVANFDGEDVMIWSIDNLNKVTDANAWIKVNAAAVKGYEAPYINKYNGKYFLYADRFTDWNEYHDAWEGQYFTFASSADSLNKPFDNYVHIRTIDNNGKIIENRHGSVITLTDANAAAVARQLYNTQYKQ